MKRHTIPRLKEQEGIVLILSLFVMTILSILGLAFLMTARTEDTIAAIQRITIGITTQETTAGLPQTFPLTLDVRLRNA